MNDGIIPLYVLFNGGNHTRNTRYARNLKILMLELIVCWNKVNTEAFTFFIVLFESPSFYSNNDKTWVRILKENDFRESEKAAAQNLIRDLKIVADFTIPVQARENK